MTARLCAIVALMSLVFFSPAATGTTLRAIREQRTALEFADVQSSISDASASLGALQESAATVLSSFLPGITDLARDNLWTPIGRNATLKYAWTIREQYLAPHLEGRRGTLRSANIFAASTLWHVQLVFSGCGSDPSAPVSLQLAPTLGSLTWRDADVVTLEGRLELPGAPRGARWRQHAFTARVTKHVPATLPGLTCGRLRQSMSADGGIIINAYFDDIGTHWHPDSVHVEAQLWRAAQQHFTTSALASRLGVNKRLRELNASHTFVTGGGPTGLGTLTVLYRHGAEASHDYLKVLRRLLYDNVACHVAGDRDAAARQFCALQATALWPQLSRLGGAELLRLLSPCEDGSSEPSPAAAAAGMTRRSSAAVPFNAGPACGDVDATNSFESVLAAVLRAKDRSLASTGPSASRPGQGTAKKDAMGQRAHAHAPTANPTPPQSPHRQNFSESNNASMPAALCALMLVLGAWYAGGRVANAKSVTRFIKRPERRPNAAEPKTGAGRAPARAPRCGSSPQAQPKKPAPPSAVIRAQPAQPAPQAAIQQRQQQPRGTGVAGQPPRRRQVKLQDGNREAPLPQLPSELVAVKEPQAQLEAGKAQDPRQAPMPVRQAATPPSAQAGHRRQQRAQGGSEQAESEVFTQPAAAAAVPTTVPAAAPPVQRTPGELANALASPASSGGADGSAGAGPGEGSSCLVCLDRPWQHGFLHGGSVHIGVCGECLAALQAAAAGRGRGARMSCPVCRGEVERPVALFA